MKFGDKLVSLRKKYGYSQEDLAAKLNVSRQSVSKWESNNTYPETDKIVQICNIFDCKMDDLINDKVLDVSQCERKNRNNWSMVFDSLLEFLTKSVNMFSSMKFSSALRCVIEIIFLILCLMIAGAIVSSVCIEIIMNIFSFVSGHAYYVVRGIVSGIFEVVLCGLGFIILIHIYKVRYLDYYDKLVSETENSSNKVDFEKDNVVEDKVKDKQVNDTSETKFKLEQKTPKIIIRDKHEPFAFLSVISKIIVAFCKFVTVFIVMAFACSLILLVFALVVGLSLGFSSLLFSGIDLGIVSAIVVNVLILLILITFIFDKKINWKVITYVFLVSLLLCGVGIGLAFIGIKDFRFVDNNSDGIEFVDKTLRFDYMDNLIIDAPYYGSHELEIIVDDTMNEEIEVVAHVDSRADIVDLNYNVYRHYGLMKHHIWYDYSFRFPEAYKLIVDDLKNHIIRDYSIDYRPLTIRCSKSVANKLISNMRKAYTFYLEARDNNNYYYLDNIQDALSVDDYACSGESDAVTGEFSYNEGYCSCKKTVSSSSDGNRTWVTCEVNDEE